MSRGDKENSGVDLSQWVHPSILKKNNSRNMLQRSVGALPAAGSSRAMLPGQASSVMAGALSGQYVPQPTASVLKLTRFRPESPGAFEGND